MIMFFLALTIALIVSSAWQKHQDSKLSSTHSDIASTPEPSSPVSNDGPASPSSIPSMRASVNTEDSSELSSQAVSSEDGNTSLEGDASSSSSSGSAPIGISDTLVPVSQTVSPEYFNDALFIGDSITSGIGEYKLLPNATVIAHTGINPSTILTSPVYETAEGESLTLLDAAQDVDARKIYVMIGANGISWIGKESFIGYYTQIIERLKEDHPDAIIYVQSILPVTKERSDSDPTLSNLKIDDYNISIQKMAEELKVYYLNVAEVIKDSNGALPYESSPHDGIHFGVSTYQKWFDYLMCHVVDADNTVYSSSSSESSSSEG
jgi:lysophospholipase L1-like esterase